MSPRVIVWLTAVLCSARATGVNAQPVASRAAAAPVARITPNDNRRPAGRLRGDTLRLALVTTLGEWHPDGARAPGVTIPAFAVEGGTASVPGPLVRVRQGSTVVVTVRNALPNDTLRLQGLHPRPFTTPADTAAITLLPGERRTLTFTLTAPGTFYYWGTTTRRVMGFRTGLDAQLTGAIVVDPRDAASPPRDRIFVLGMWTDTVARSFLPRHRVLGVVNGRSWPNSETLTATVGDTVRWRVINASGDLHPMHLHGFYFRVTARGDGATDTLFTADRAPGEVTEALTMGATYAMTWVPERAGNWLYHCHIPEHFGPRAPLGLPRDTTGHAAQIGAVSHAQGGMSGLVLGVTVRQRGGAAGAAIAAPPRDLDAGRRRLRLLVRESAGSTAREPLFSYAIHEGGAEPPRDSGRVASPTLVVTRGEPVRITVVNRLAEPTAVHWHGIELESYYDGVPGFSGMGTRTTPLIAPGDSFVVRFTPPRAGTFIYHTHYDEDRQQGAGLAGALVVRDPARPFDASRDHPILITSPTDQGEASRVVYVNGALSPAPIVVRAGERVRVRLINMTLRRSGVRLALRRGGVVLPWTLVAKDGADVAPALAITRAVAQLVSIGETYDYEFSIDQPGEVELEVRVGTPTDARVFGVQPIRVVAAR
ncbi:MAG: multicopper oxidase domain-containing protein [Gemmatimonadaceae bacterium]|nr:multicopper oxidase domain-containing protein [Gemmatimonadaceae bacterium]